MILGIDIGGTFTRFGKVHRNLHVEELIKVHTNDIVDDFSAFLNRYLNNDSRIEKIVIGFPGVVDPTTNSIIKIANKKTLESLNLAQLSDTLNLPIKINKDTYHLFYYHQSVFDLTATSNILGFYLGTGLGNVIYLNHRIHMGDTYSASELGHQEIYGSLEPCSCGLKGCNETKLSGHYLEFLHRTYFKKIPLEKLFLSYESQKNGFILEEFLDYFAFVIANQVHILDVRTIVLGGGIPHMQGFPQNHLNSLINSHIRHPRMLPLNIYFTQPNPESGVIGAAIAGYQKETL